MLWRLGSNFCRSDITKSLNYSASSLYDIWGKCSAPLASPPDKLNCDFCRRMNGALALSFFINGFSQSNVPWLLVSHF